MNDQSITHSVTAQEADVCKSYVAHGRGEIGPKFRSEFNIFKYSN